MKLPNLEAAVVSEEKVKGYLLNPTHPDGVSKARFFMLLGFRADQWDVLATALRKMAENWPVAVQIESAHGWKYIVDGVIDTPSGNLAEVRTIWIVDRTGKNPRLVTAYPRKSEE